MAKNKKTVAVDFQNGLYRKFSKSKFRKQFNTDGECIRAAIRDILIAENHINTPSQCQDKKTD